LEIRIASLAFANRSSGLDRPRSAKTFPLLASIVIFSPGDFPRFDVFRMLFLRLFQPELD
jgi:hypothetical protein